MTNAQIINKIVALEKSQLGVKESPVNSNNVKYNTWFYGKSVEGSNYAWCVTFQNWCFNQCGLGKYFYGGEKIASCTALMEYYQKKYPSLVVTKDFKKGDLILFNFDQDTYPDHIGICSDVVNSTSIKTIEGNTGTLSQDNGGKVMEKNRNISLVKCGIRWWMMDEINNTTTEVNKTVTKLNIELEMLQTGSQGKQVKALQILLNGVGSSCGMPDSVFGSKTEFAVKDFQGKNRLTKDGVVGLKTWNKLLKGE